MKRVLIALAAPLVLIGAAHPPGDGRFYPPVPALEPVAGPVTYRPCRPGPGDDRCIQLYEAGITGAGN